ncbi:hypothetical protein L1887_00333 [Cichorium endivia]|nr:hypothetical protein L1887_00333 [Cichorium endivia]
MSCSGLSAVLAKKSYIRVEFDNCVILRGDRWHVTIEVVEEEGNDTTFRGLCSQTTFHFLDESVTNRRNLDLKPFICL